MPRRANRRTRRRRGRRGNVSSGPSRAPRTTLKRTFRDFITVNLDNITAGYSYHSKYYSPNPVNCIGFRDTQQTFEFWKLNRFRIKIQPGYNSYNQTYNSINQDAIAAMQVWTASDFSAGETLAGTSILSYNNAKVHTLSLNGIKTVVNTAVRLNQRALMPRTILPANTWLDTQDDITTTGNIYSGAQLYARMQGQTTTNYVAQLQLILEYDVEFKQPAYQNRPNYFESSIVGSTLTVIPDGNLPEITRSYNCVSYTINATGNDYRFERSDGQPGSLNYDLEELWEVYIYRTSGQYFNNRSADYQGPIPRRPLNWTEAEPTANDDSSESGGTVQSNP